MAKYNKEATDENILNSIRNDILQRTTDVKNFIRLLETIDTNSFIALDGAWGSGKTFFVRQVELTLNYHYMKCFGKEITNTVENAFFDNEILANMKLNNSYIALYFDSWLYDNNDNALMALLFAIIKQSEKIIDYKIDTKMEIPFRDNILAIIKSLNFWKFNFNDLKLEGTDILSNIYTLEEVREKIKDCFNQIIAENGQKMVIFIDELDRCKPTFAVDLLERIKHFFDDDRIIFVLSTNKEQLIHTLSKYYGNGFDSSRYLNKFFDINICLPKGDIDYYFKKLNMADIRYDNMLDIAKELQRYYRLTLRDTTIYFQKITSIIEKYNKEGHDTWYALCIFVPIISILDIIDISKKNEILNGKGIEYLTEIILANEWLRNVVLLLIKKENQYKRDDVNIDLEEFKIFYKYYFENYDPRKKPKVSIDIDGDFKDKVIKIYDGFDDLYFTGKIRL